GYDIGSVEEHTRRCVPVSCSITFELNRSTGLSQCSEDVQTAIIVEANMTLDNRRLIMSKVFVVDSYYKPLDPVHPGWARLLLKQGKASVYRRFPFTIILKRVVEQPQVEPLRLKLDPGSQTSGIAVVNDASGEVVFAANLTHRGKAIKKGLESR